MLGRWNNCSTQPVMQSFPVPEEQRVDFQSVKILQIRSPALKEKLLTSPLMKLEPILFPLTHHPRCTVHCPPESGGVHLNVLTWLVLWILNIRIKNCTFWMYLKIFVNQKGLSYKGKMSHSLKSWLMFIGLF